MKAVVLHAYGSVAELSYQEAPDPAPKSNEALVRVHAASINPVDWMLRSGAVRDLIPIDFPYILGIDMAGIIEAVGDEASGFKVGDRVMAIASGAYAELCVVRTEQLAHVPDGLTLIEAPALPLVNLTGDQLVRLGAKAAPGETVLVTGALGGVGRSAVFAAAEIGAIVIAGVRARRLDEARRLPGVAEAVAIDDDLAIEALPTLDAVADTVGGEIAAKLASKVRRGGRFGCFPSTRAAVGDPPEIEVNSIFAHADAATTRRYAEAVRDGRLSIPVSRIMPLAEAAEAQRIAEQGAGGKIILRP
jgi:NADPH:quinone reductase-like Zn-dependent oxidoreductase